MRLIDAHKIVDKVCEGISCNECSFNMIDGEAGCLLDERIHNLPTAQQWIPCSERLPEEPNVYTVTDSKGDVVRFVFYNNESSRKYWKRCAKAWMTLPKPWKGEQDD